MQEKYYVISKRKVFVEITDDSGLVEKFCIIIFLEKFLNI